MDRIKIHDFGPIKDIDIELSRLMVFIGPQGSGKSTIAKLLTIFSDVYWWMTICRKKDSMSEFKKMGISKYFESDTEIEYHGRDEVSISYRNGIFDIAIKGYSPDEALRYCAMLIGQSTKDNLSEIGVNLENPQIGKTIKDNFNFIRANYRLACYIPAERNMAGVVSSSLANMVLSKIPLPNTLLEYLSLFERTKKHFTSYDASFLGVRYEKENGTECISVLDNTEKHLPLEECSSGIQSALPMLMVSDYAKEEQQFDTYVIEEPEQNLFPTNQREVLNRLIAIANSDACSNMVITTHSPYLLSVLNISILAEKLSNNVENIKEVNNIVDPMFRMNSDSVSVFSLGGKTYCESIKDNKTGLVSVNYLDLVSESIGSDFSRLYQLYLKSLKK